MSLLIKLYGNLRDNLKGLNIEKGLPVTYYIEDTSVHFVYEILDMYGINENELSHIFVNSKYCGTGKEVKDGDRVGLFPKNMALMFVEIPDLNSICVTIKLLTTLRKYERPKFSLKIPEGSTIKTLMNKLKFQIEDKNFIFILNGSPKFDKNIIIEDGDILSIFSPLDGG